MADAIATGTLSQKWVQFAPDSIWDGEALPNATTKTSSEFEVGKDQGKVSVAVRANTAISIADGESLTLTLQKASASGGTFADEVQFYDATGDGAVIAFAAGDIIAEIIPGSTDIYKKIVVETSADESSEDIDAFLRRVSG